MGANTNPLAVKMLGIAVACGLLLVVGFQLRPQQRLPVTEQVSCPDGIGGVTLGDSFATLVQSRELQATPTSLGIEVQQRLAVADPATAFDEHAEWLGTRALWQPVIAGRDATCMLEFNRQYILVRISCDLALSCERDECAQIQDAVVAALEERYGPAPQQSEAIDLPAVGIRNQVRWLWSDAECWFQVQTATLRSAGGPTSAQIRLEAVSVAHRAQLREMKRHARTKASGRPDVATDGAIRTQPELLVDRQNGLEEQEPD